MKVFITGVAGFIGYYVAKQLIKEGHSVFGIDNLNDYYDQRLKDERLFWLRMEPNNDSQFQFRYADLRNYKKLEQYLTEYQPDVILHLAAQAGVRYSLDHPGEYIESNIVGTFNLFEAAKNTNHKNIVYASSSSVYGDSQDTDHPVSLYAATKKSTELLAHSYHKTHKMNMLGLRFFTVYGPMGRPDMAYFTFTKKILAGEPIDVYNNGNLSRDFTYVTDIADGVIGAVKDVYTSPVDCRVCDLGGGHPYTLMEFINTIEKTVKKEAVKNYVPMQNGDVRDTLSDNTKAREWFGYNPKTSLETGIREFYTWYMEYYHPEV